MPRPSTTSPSLSSTVDTLQSTPTHTPVQHGASTFEQWRGFETVELSEPIRTKRKFDRFKPAKRLPHYTAPHEEGEGIWEVHAAVIDVGIGDFEGFRRDAGTHVTAVEEGKGVEETVRVGTEEKSSGRKGRVVRFEGVETEDSSSGTELSDPTQARQEKEPTLSSSYSLSKFNFPAPPGRTWTGTFGTSKD